MQGLTIPKLPDILMPVPVVKSGDDIGKYIRLAMMTAMLSVCFERLPHEFIPLLRQNPKILMVYDAEVV